MSAPLRRQVTATTKVWLAVAVCTWLAGVVAVVHSPASVAAVVSAGVVASIMLTTGAIIVLRSDVARIGWLLLATGATIHLFTAAEAVDAAVRTDAQLLWLSIIGLSPLPLMLAIVLFPSGRATTPFGRALVWFTLVSQLGAHTLQVAAAVDVIGGDWATYRALADTSVPLTVFGALGMHVIAYRRRPRIQQLQVKYLILGLSLAAASFFVSESGGALMVGGGMPANWKLVIDPLGPGLVPIAIMLAMTRYRLYDIDRFISRTLAYALVVGLLGLLFVVGVATVAGVLPTQDRLAVALTTVVVIALFDPLRRRAVDVLDRRFDRTRYVARQVVDDFGRDVQDVTDVGEIADRVGAVVHRTLAPSTVALWQPTAPPRGGTS
jgi:hypothetical protein